MFALRGVSPFSNCLNISQLGSKDDSQVVISSITKNVSPFYPGCSQALSSRTYQQQSPPEHAKIVKILAEGGMYFGTLHASRRAAAFVRGDDVLHKLFTELAYRYKERAGGYTRLLRTRIRMGDAAPMAYIEFVDRENELREAKPPAAQPSQRVPLDPWTKSRLSKQWASPKEERSVSESEASTA